MSLHLKVSSPSASGVLKGGGGGDGFLVKNLQVPKTTVARVADIEEEEEEALSRSLSSTGKGLTATFLYPTTPHRVSPLPVCSLVVRLFCALDVSLWLSADAGAHRAEAPWVAVLSG